MKLIIWGAGKRTNDLLRDGFFSNHTIVNIVDSYKSGVIFDYEIIKPEGIGKKYYDYLVIMVEKFEPILVQAIELGIPFSKILITDYVNVYPFADKWSILCELEPKFTDDRFTYTRWQKIRMNEKDYIDPNRLLGNVPYDSSEYMEDYLRYRTFEYVAEELIENKVIGALAEFGVFRGAFSSLISKKFSDREIYLFDTFEGFDSSEGEKELSEGNCNKEFLESHKNTSVECMLSNMPDRNKCKVFKGLFPGSITTEAENTVFAFVSIDVDFEDSIYEGLKFFYPRLSEGGVIFVHDYNSAYLKGVKKAVIKYEHEIGYSLHKVPIADRAGTLIIIK